MKRILHQNVSSRKRKREDANEEVQKETTKKKTKLQQKPKTVKDQQSSLSRPNETNNPETDCFTDAVNVNKLSKLIQSAEPEAILLRLLTPRFGFMERMDLGSIAQPLTEMLIQAISVACQSKHSDSVIKLLCHINSSRWMKVDLLRYLNLFITDEAMSENTEVLRRILCILKLLVVKFPRKSFDTVTTLLAPIHYLQHSRGIEISTEDIEEELSTVRKHIQLSVPTRDLEKEEACMIDAEKFRWLSTAPTCEDIKGKGDPHLRKNKIFSRYSNVDDYLDVQFRLLREDLIRPLREGLAELLESRRHPTGKRRQSVMKVYQKVQIVSWRCSPNGIIYKIQLDMSRLKKVKWGSAKRLIFGSLVCLSTDQFQTMLIGTIADRNVKDLCSGVVFVKFENEDTQINMVQFNCCYEMIESPAYYEPYKHVLGVLQYLDEETLPFKRYLLNHGHDKVPEPKYLQNRNFIFDFSSITERIDKKCSDIDKQNGLGLPLMEEDTQNLDSSSWPSADQLGLDDSQYCALRAALTKEFVVIQGPPGTGKTFIGVLIVQLLLENKCRPVLDLGNPFLAFQRYIEPLWEGPILIVCYTNHALDQFLEDIIKRHPEKVTGNEIVRLGGRGSSENENLKRCQLSEIVRQSSFRHEIGRTRGRIRGIEDQLMRSAAFIELTHDELLHETVLKDFMSHGQFEMLTHYTQGQRWIPSVLFLWLYNSRNAWQSGVLREEAEDVFIKEEEEFRDDNLEEQRFDWRQNSVEYAKSVNDFRDCKEQIRNCNFLKPTVSQHHSYFNLWQSMRKIHKRFQEKEPFYEENVWDLELDNRWRLYNYWVSLCVDQKMAEMQAAHQKYSQAKKRLDSMLHSVHCTILSNAEIVAMTTSAAASHNKLLKAIKPKIVIVEEAAEVLEAHIIASLSEDCQHLIMIGDHKQLRPKPADFHLAKQYWLQVSLFERMFLNRMNSECLTIQHRMRPEISKLLVPHIYRSLLDHSNVHKYDNIAGVMGNLFFLSHSVEESRVDEMNSHSNEHEALFLAAFCKYLLNVGYSSNKITVLTMYTGQLFLLRKYFPKKDFEGVRITAVDNFQGEENDIILLSLVRSNSKSTIGFLSIPNRVCVALSRARKGLYIIGNGDLLRDVSPLWRDILDTLKSEDRLVEKMPLGCHKHPDIASYVSCAADFSAVPDYGCKFPCEFRLDCGHACERNCHPFDQNHKEYIGRKPCESIPKNCLSGHRCLKRCHEYCGECEFVVKRTLSLCQHEATMPCYMKEEMYLLTRRCRAEVERILSKCGHLARMACYRLEQDFRCLEACKKACPAGHACPKKCFEFCGNCEATVEKVLARCQHKVGLPCHQSEETYACQNKCSKTCPEGHPCPKLCSEPCGDCVVPVLRSLPLCEHEAMIACHVDSTDYTCQEPCKRLCPLGHKCHKICGVSCGDCQVRVEKILPRCKHSNTVECHLSPDDVICPLPCKKSLSCGHKCQEICGQPDCTTLCKVEVERLLPCGHNVRMECFEDPNSFKCLKKIEIITCTYGHKKMVECCNSVTDFSLCLTLVTKMCSSKLHRFKVPCILQNCSQYDNGCQNKCNVKLKCGHRCQNTCQQCVTDAKHSDCTSVCNKYNPLCSHKCLRGCGDPCGICNALCEIKCHHRTLHLNCNLPYTSCDKPCRWTCPHHSCRALCSQPCDRGACNEPCRNKLKNCGHGCIGLCGEVCPKICGLCDKITLNEMTEELGVDLTEESRFLLLKPCDHIVEKNYLDSWVKRHMQISPPYKLRGSLFLKCPLCTSKVTYCPRYNREMKTYELHINEAKLRILESRKVAIQSRNVTLFNRFHSDLPKDIMKHRINLGTLCLLRNTRELVETIGKADRLRMISDEVEKAVCLDISSEDVEQISVGLAAGVIRAFRIYLETQICRLKRCTRGPKLRIVESCEDIFKSLRSVPTREVDLQKTWNAIEKVNRLLSKNLDRRERNDGIGDYIEHISQLYDVELNANYNSHWFCCTDGHVYSRVEDFEEDQIDSNCPSCHPVYKRMLKVLQTNRSKTTVNDGGTCIQRCRDHESKKTSGTKLETESMTARSSGTGSVEIATDRVSLTEKVDITDEGYAISSAPPKPRKRSAAEAAATKATATNATQSKLETIAKATAADVTSVKGFQAEIATRKTTVKTATATPRRTAESDTAYTTSRIPTERKDDRDRSGGKSVARSKDAKGSTNSKTRSSEKREDLDSDELLPDPEDRWSRRKTPVYASSSRKRRRQDSPGNSSGMLDERNFEEELRQHKRLRLHEYDHHMAHDDRSRCRTYRRTPDEVRYPDPRVQNTEGPRTYHDLDRPEPIYSNSHGMEISWSFRRPVAKGRNSSRCVKPLLECMPTCNWGPGYGFNPIRYNPNLPASYQLSDDYFQD